MPNEYDLHLNSARRFFDEGNYEAAKAAAQHAIEAVDSAEGMDAKMLLAMALRKLEFDDEAFKMLGEIMLGEPSPEIRAAFALMRAERNMCDESCRENAEQAMHDVPDLPDPYLALFWYHAAHNNFLEAITYLKRGINRGAEFSSQRAFALVHDWCQEACDSGDYATAFAISTEIVELFGTLDFLLLHARLADTADEPRISVQYYKRALVHLRPGPMRTSVLEAVAKIAI